MKILEEQLEIPREKLTDYLLVPKEKNDKSKFLSELGYFQHNWEELAQDLKTLAAENEANLQSKTSFGEMFEINGKLKEKGVVTIWLLALGSNKYRFITLFPS